MASELTERDGTARCRAAHRDVTRALIDASTLTEAIPRVLQALCENLGWHRGEGWLVDDRARHLRHLATWPVPGPESNGFCGWSGRTTLAEGETLPGRVWQSGQPLWMADGTHSAAGFPVALKGQVLGVLVFVGCEIYPADDDLLESMAVIGGQVGQFIQHGRTEEALRQSEADLKLALDGGRLGQWKCDLLTEEVTWSPLCKALYGLPADAEVGYERFRAAIHPDDRGSVDAELKRAIET
jgi:PAS domain-containing protein